MVASWPRLEVQSEDVAQSFGIVAPYENAAPIDHTWLTRYAPSSATKGTPNVTSDVRDPRSRLPAGKE